MYIVRPTGGSENDLNVTDKKGDGQVERQPARYDASDVAPHVGW